MKTIEKRKVRIVPHSGCGVEILNDYPPQGYFVRYVDRKKGQRWNAAGFDARVKNREQVAEWVKAQPNLELVEPCAQSTGGVR